MSTNVSGAHNSTDLVQAEDNDAVDTLIDVVYDLKDVVERQADRIDNLESVVQDQAERIDEFENNSESNEDASVEFKSEDDSPALTDLWIGDFPLGQIVDANRKRSGDAEKMAEEAIETSEGPDPEDVAGNEEAARHIAQTVGEHLTMQPASICDNKNQERAQYILKNLKRYAEKTKYGWILRPKTMRSILYSRENTAAAAHDQTISRVRDTFEDLCGDEVKVVKSGRQKLVQFTDDIVNRLKNLEKIRDRCPSLVCEDRMTVRG